MARGEAACLSASDRALSALARASRGVSFLFRSGRRWRTIVTMNGRTQAICDWAEDAPDAIWLARRASDEAQCLVQVRRGKRGPFRP